MIKKCGKKLKKPLHKYKWRATMNLRNVRTISYITKGG